MTLVPLAMAESVGCEAKRMISSGRGEVAVVFRRSFYLRVEQNLACFGAPEIGCGPLNILLRTESDIDWRTLLKPGRAAKTSHGSLLIDGLAPIVFSDADIWKSPLFLTWSKNDLLRGLAELDRRLIEFQPPVGGLGSFALSESGTTDP